MSMATSTVPKAFRWSHASDLALAKEVVGRRPANASEWALVANAIARYCQDGQVVTARNCKEHMALLINHHEKENRRALQK